MTIPAPYPVPQYPDAQKAISARARFLYGSINHLARQVGLTRQAFHGRAVLATFSTSTHPWFEFLLHLPEGCLAEGVPDLELTRPVPAASIAYGLAASDDAWLNRARTRARRVKGEG